MEVLVNREFFSDKDRIREALKIIVDIIKWADRNNVTLYRNEKVDYNAINVDPKLYRAVTSVIGFYQRLKVLEHGEIFLNEGDVEPQVSEDMIEQIEAAIGKDIKYMLSILCVDQEPRYFVRSKSYIIENLRTQEELETNYMYDPPAKSISEVFNKIQELNSKVIFTKNAYDTSVERADVYRQFGFNRIIELFSIAHKELFPYMLGETKHIAEKKIFENL